MKRDEIKKNSIVVDRWYMEYGTGLITDVKKTVFTVVFGGKKIKYDYAHSRFLDSCQKI